MLRFGPFDILRVRYFGIGTASILRALTSSSGRGAVDTFGIGRFGSVRYRNRYLRYTIQSGIETKPAKARITPGEKADADAWRALGGNGGGVVQGVNPSGG